MFLKSTALNEQIIHLDVECGQLTDKFLWDVWSNCATSAQIFVPKRRSGRLVVP